MADNGILMQLKKITPDFIDSNGNFKTFPTGKTAELELPNNHIKFIIDFLSLLKTTNIINQATRMYIFDRYITSSGVNEKLKYEAGIDKTASSTLGSIQYDKRKLERLFGSHMIIDVLSKNKDISKYELILAECFVNKSDSALRSGLSLKIKQDCMNSSMTDKEFADFIDIIAPYTCKQMRFIEDNLDVMYCGYFNYLLSMPSLNDVDKHRLDILKELLTN